MKRALCGIIAAIASFELIKGSWPEIIGFIIQVCLVTAVSPRMHKVLSGKIEKVQSYLYFR